MLKNLYRRQTQVEYTVSIYRICVLNRSRTVIVISDYIFSGRLVFLVVIWALLSAMVGFRGTYTDFVNLKPIPGIEAKAAISMPIKPDFSQINDVKRKKQEFFDYLTPYIEEANLQVLQIRSNLLRIAETANGGEINGKDSVYLKTMASVYRSPKYIVDDSELVNDLLKRVDVIPVSLALAQAANETAWGTSRFAVKGNNYFGIWCFSKGCGIVPRERNGGEAHEVAKFIDPAESAAYYIKQLNSHNNYQLLRDLRAQARNSDSKVISGNMLADGLENYSAIGMEYVSSIRSIIRVNKLDQFDFVVR